MTIEVNTTKNNLILVIQDNRFFVGNACARDGSFEPKSSKARALCCKFDGSSCIAVPNSSCEKNKLNLRYHDAEVECQKIGHRLCSKDELLSNMCCKASENCDQSSIWTLTSESGMFYSLI